MTSEMKDQEQSAWIYVARHRSSDSPWASGDIADAYEIAGPVEIVKAQPPELTRDAVVVGVPRSMGHCVATDLDAMPRDRKRAHQVHTCPCRKGAKAWTFARSFIVDGGQIVVRVEPQVFPPAHKDDVNSARQDGGAVAYPLHRHANGTAHIEVTSCRRCRRPWAILIADDEYRVHPIVDTRMSVVVQ